MGDTTHVQAGTALATTTIVCIECLRPWVERNERWRLKVLDDGEPETVPYCPDCATREFGPA
jgi:hypothetical protein